MRFLCPEIWDLSIEPLFGIEKASDLESGPMGPYTSEGRVKKELDEKC